MRILLFEDSQAEYLSPVALLRPVFELTCGRESLRRRLKRWFPSAEFGAWVRPWLVDAWREEQPDFSINDPDWLQQGPVLLINGRWLPDRRLTALEFACHQAGFLKDQPVWLYCDGAAFLESHQGDFPTSMAHFAGKDRILQSGGGLIEYPWDLVNQNSAQLIRDFRDEGISGSPLFDHVQILGDPADVYISAMASLDPYVVIDARSGPVSIDRDAQIQSFTRIEGPCHIGRGTQVFRALIRKGTTLGEHCRVGGEIEESVLHGFVNKYHEGFLGHSYVCPWVNIGAMTSTSDLKNDYSTVRIPLQGQLIDSGITKVGSFIGDHSKTALDSMFNTGSSIGVMTMVLPGGRLLPRHIPSFCSVMWGELSSDWSLDASIETARAVMLRRGQQMTQNYERLLRIVHQRTEMERQTALRRATQRKAAGQPEHNTRSASS